MIGIYGGTFDPIHYGHLRTALEVKALLRLHQLRLMPSFQPPHRDLPSVTAEQRLQMLQLAIADEVELLVDTRELQRQGPSYMVDTLSSLRHEMATEPLALIIGHDAFKLLTGWHQWQRLFDYAHIVVMSRSGEQINADRLSPFFKQRFCASVASLHKKKQDCLFFQTVTQLDISASQIRDILTKDRNPRFLLPDSVLNYIKENQLYSGNYFNQVDKCK